MGEQGAWGVHFKHAVRSPARHAGAASRRPPRGRRQRTGSSASSVVASSSARPCGRSATRAPQRAAATPAQSAAAAAGRCTAGAPPPPPLSLPRAAALVPAPAARSAVLLTMSGKITSIAVRRARPVRFPARAAAARASSSGPHCGASLYSAS